MLCGERAFASAQCSRDESGATDLRRRRFGETEECRKGLKAVPSGSTRERCRVRCSFRVSDALCNSQFSFPVSVPRVRCPPSQFVSGLSARRGIIEASEIEARCVHRESLDESPESASPRHSRHLVIFACLGFLGSSKTSASRRRRRRRRRARSSRNHWKLWDGLAKMGRGGEGERPSSRGTIAVIMETNATSGTGRPRSRY